MDIINTLMNIVFAPTSLCTLFFFYPSYLFLKFLLYISKSIFSEDVAGKVVLITGASSGIGEHLAYEYAKRGACLALVARREFRLRHVADNARFFGSPDVFVVQGDVSRVDDCKKFVDATVKHFGRLDHLVTNAGVSPVSMFEDIPDLTKFAPSMDINFWGSVYSTYAAVPHLKMSKGKIVVVASCASWLPAPRMSLYCASKAALVAMYDTLRVELAPEISVTIANPGLIDTEMTAGKFLTQQGRLELDEEMRDVMISVMLLESPARCAKAIMNSACRGDKYLTEPAWYRAIFYVKVFIPELIEWTNRFFFLPRHGQSETETVTKKINDLFAQLKGHTKAY